MGGEGRGEGKAGAAEAARHPQGSATLRPGGAWRPLLPLKDKVFRQCFFGLRQVLRG